MLFRSTEKRIRDHFSGKILSDGQPLSIVTPMNFHRVMIIEISNRVMKLLKRIRPSNINKIEFQKLGREGAETKHEQEKKFLCSSSYLI